MGQSAPPEERVPRNLRERHQVCSIGLAGSLGKTAFGCSISGDKTLDRILVRGLLGLLAQQHHERSSLNFNLRFSISADELAISDVEIIAESASPPCFDG